MWVFDDAQAIAEGILHGRYFDAAADFGDWFKGHRAQLQQAGVGWLNGGHAPERLRAARPGGASGINPSSNPPTEKPT